MAFTLSRLHYRLGKFVEAGWVETGVCEGDRRAHFVRITEAGVEHFVHLAQVHERHLEALFGERFGAEELGVVRSLVEGFDLGAVRGATRLSR